MKLIKPALLQILVALSLPISGGVLADNYRSLSDRGETGAVAYDYAEVLHAEPIQHSFERRIPVENCWNEQVRNERARPEASSSYLGPVLGAVIGGGLGNAVGHHKRNQQVGAAVGAVLGATVGHEITRDKSAGGSGVDVYYTNERRCDTTYEVEADHRTVGYWVTYQYRGQEYRTRMDSHPGQRIRVRVTVEPA